MTRFIARIFIAVILCLTGLAPAWPMADACRICGTWTLLDRIDRDRDGHEVMEPVLGRNPEGLLIYDAAGTVSVQIMKRDRLGAAGAAPVTGSGNNTGSGNGFDSYFGQYELDPAAGLVTHILRGAVVPDDVGKRISRRLAWDNEILVLSFDTNNGDRPVTRTLRWKKISSP